MSHSSGLARRSSTVAQSVTWKSTVNADRLQLLLGDDRLAIHVRVFLGRHEAERRAVVAGLLQLLLGQIRIVHVVALFAGRRVPGGLLHHQTRIEPDEIVRRRGPIAASASMVECRLDGLAHRQILHHRRLPVQEEDVPVGRREDLGDDARVILEHVVLVVADVERQVGSRRPAARPRAPPHPAPG